MHGHRLAFIETSDIVEKIFRLFCSNVYLLDYGRVNQARRKNQVVRFSPIAEASFNREDERDAIWMLQKYASHFDAWSKGGENGPETLAATMYIRLNNVGEDT